MNTPILFTRYDHWIEVCLNRPNKLNAFNDSMHEQLYACLNEASTDTQVRAVLLTGAGRGFCAGQDLSDRDPSRREQKPDLSQSLVNYYNPLVKLIKDMQKPVVCAVNGVAAGAGANIALACDIVLAADSARFIQSFSRVGLVPDSGGTWSLTHLLGPARAKGLALTGDSLSATDAQQWGLIWKCYPQEQLMIEAHALTRKLASGPTQGLSKTKLAIDCALSNSFEEQLALEAKLQYECGLSHDYAEGVSAFLEKRDAEFTGQAH